MPRKAATPETKARKAMSAGKKPPGALMLAVAARLRVIQKELGKTDQAMADTLAIGRSSWSNWTNALNMPEEEAMIRLCVIAGVTLDWIYRGNFDGLALASAIRLMARLRGIDPDDAGAEVLMGAE